MRKLKGAVSHHEREVAELREDRGLAIEYLQAAMESLDDPNDRAAGLLALRTVAEAYKSDPQDAASGAQNSRTASICQA